MQTDTGAVQCDSRKQLIWSDWVLQPRTPNKAAETALPPPVPIIVSSENKKEGLLLGGLTWDHRGLVVPLAVLHG
jgi:hypothetical protein